MLLTLALNPAAAGEVTLFAAASTHDALSEVVERFNANGEHRAVVSFAASSTLAKQITAGAPAGLYLAASPMWMSYVADRGHVREHQDFVGNTLVLVAPKGQTSTVVVTTDTDLITDLDGRRIAIGDPEHVPAGQYAKAALEHIGQWAAVAPHLARAKDVRAALAYVERGETPLGIVYATDAAASDRVTIVGTFPESAHPPVTYPIALLSDDPAAQSFYSFILSEFGYRVFERHGFSRP